MQNSDPLYSNVRVRIVEPDIASGSLTVKVIYAQREERSIVYEGVLYSQLDESANGGLVALAMELAPAEYRDARHGVSASLLRKDCKLDSLDALDEMVRQGYRIFTHYIGEHDELVIIAKNLIIG